MPLYDYQCESCGTFSAIRKMSESSEPNMCETCGEMAPRIISAPNLALVSSATRNAHERNEKSAHEPVYARRSSCGCSGSHSCKPSTKKEGQQSENKGTGLSMQTKKTARPWMLGH
jgi:putative FmdB family regulatory protein